MKKTFSTALTLAAAGVFLLHTPRVSAQDDAPPPPPPGAPAAAGAPGAGGPGGDRMEQFRQRMEERVKTQLKATDDEWSVIQPLLEKVETKQREALTTRFGGMMGGGGPRGPRPEDANGGNGGGANGGGRREQRDNAGGGGDRRPDRAGGRGGSPEAQALTTALQNDSATTDEIKTKLAALREQRKKSAAELAQSREDLKKVLNMRQEATLVAMGILD